MSVTIDGVPDINSWNSKIIDEFRVNDSEVGGQFEGVPLLPLHTTGARSGKERINPTVYQDLGGPIVVFASKAGADITCRTATCAYDLIRRWQ